MLSNLLLAPLSAASVSSEAGLRNEFLQAERQIGSVKYQQAQKLLQKFAEYPLQPYLELRRLQQFLTADERIAAFLQQHQGSPLDWPLRKPWLLDLARRQKAGLYLANYQGSTDAELECYAVRFKLAAKDADSDRLWPEVSRLWLVGKSQPKACDPLFSAWRKAGQQTAERVWLRLTLAAEGGDASLIPYLKSQLPADMHYLADMYQQARRNPAVIANSRFFTLKKPQERDIAAYGLKRLIWRHPDQALRVWQKFVNDPYFTEAQRLDVQRQFAIALASKGDERAAVWFADLPSEFIDSTLAHWHVSHALAQLDWPKVQQIIEALPADVSNDSAWRYWLARAYEQQGQTEKATVLMQQLALQRHFYGFMAASRLGLPPSLAHAPVTVSDTELQQLQQHPTVKRAQEWLALGRLTEARREWNHLQDISSEQQKLVSAKLAYQLQWYERAIFSLADVGYWDDVELRFPLAYKDEISQSAAKAEIDSGWAMAIARRESSFMADAASPVGARGLMQLMPATARQIAKKPVQLAQLNNPVLNIDYGVDYLNYLMRRNDGNLLMATAAYNAGYSRVKQWIPKDYALPADVWVETIPYRETREYVKAVMAYYQIYNIRLNAPVDVFKPLTSMQIGVIVE
ncbi:MAG: transglycosylase SLT domain-containing protein [Gammaproteobacteria bacterium]|nr:transglycosylase SLT domain-containing protein [Gammaproteobacteria bacterium]MBU1554899.1 transglycosylase SLT domain-containing protein [Gammaproteobacteria bacterium]MBU2072405.1 transglycosylase SLT domain-containing protein [Gammaproteobacteria bacterium]MBU2183341.1 transglycosylase SLT domain-containing protein [Gammaproteobacteria bacterium]MBU2203128.1 transglycosylase SLT domain-containing protein [Gammaproteobacteria bacterium]